MRIANIDKFKKEGIDALTEKIIRLHKDILDEKKLRINEIPEVILSDKSFVNSFDRLLKELKHHIYKEEKILFPYLINLSKSLKNEIPFEQPYFETVKNPIEIMKSDHELINECLIKLKSLFYVLDMKGETKNHFTERLKNFLEEVERVIYLENEILFPVAIEAEKSLLNQ